MRYGFRDATASSPHSICIGYLGQLVSELSIDYVYICISCIFGRLPIICAGLSNMAIPLFLTRCLLRTHIVPTENNYLSSLFHVSPGQFLCGVICTAFGSCVHDWFNQLEARCFGKFPPFDVCILNIPKFLSAFMMCLVLIPSPSSFVVSRITRYFSASLFFSSPTESSNLKHFPENRIKYEERSGIWFGESTPTTKRSLGKMFRMLQ